jgi:uncharacterized protein YbaP (TraB family)
MITHSFRVGKALWFIAFLLFIAGQFISCSGSKNLKYQALDNSLLWEVSGKNIKGKSYVFGTIHLIPSDKYFWTESMEKAFRQSGEVVFELDMNEMNDMSKMLGLMQHLFMRGDTTLSDLLTKSDYDRLAAKMQNVGLPLFLFERMKPFFITTFLSDEFSGGNLQDGSMKSYELELTEKANKANKPITGLETIAFQASIFDKIPYKDQAKMLSDMLNNVSNNSSEDAEFRDMLRLYTEQNIEQLGKMIGSEQGSLSGLHDDLLYYRNEAWINPMVERMSKGTVFFAVGAGHLPGERGVLHLLRKKGLKIKPIK